MPGTYFDAMTAGTKLGKAIRAACDELDHLGGMVRRAARALLCAVCGWCVCALCWRSGCRALSSMVVYWGCSVRRSSAPTRAALTRTARTRTHTHTMRAKK